VNVHDDGWESPALGEGMGIRVYGHDGRPLIAFPSQAGRHQDLEGFGVIGSVAHLIDAGRIRIVSVDSIDGQTWANDWAHPADRAARHEAYVRYLVDELAPWIRDRTGWHTMWTVGCSMGAYHAANMLFRRPDVFDGCVAMSGLYQLRHFIGDFVDDTIYFNSPLLYLPNLEDPWYLERLRRARICIVVGQGAWEDEMLADTRALDAILAAKGIPAIVDYWGHDVNHDWDWWQHMLPYQLERMGV
jgi:esterase/lipase superfamily enzyme